MGWVQGSRHGVTQVGSSTWLAWAALVLGVIALSFSMRWGNAEYELGKHHSQRV